MNKNKPSLAIIAASLGRGQKMLRMPAHIVQQTLHQLFHPFVNTTFLLLSGYADLRESKVVVQ